MVRASPDAAFKVGGRRRRGSSSLAAGGAAEDAEFGAMRMVQRHRPAPSASVGPSSNAGRRAAACRRRRPAARRPCASPPCATRRTSGCPGFSQDAPAGLGDLRHVDGGIHLGKEHQRHRIVGIDGMPSSANSARVSRRAPPVRSRPRSGRPATCTSKPFAPARPGRRWSAPAARAALGFVHARRNGRARRARSAGRHGRGSRPSSAGFILRIGRIALVSTRACEAARQDIVQHRRQLAVHERLAAGEADLLGRQGRRARSRRGRPRLGSGEIGEASFRGVLSM